MNFAVSSTMSLQENKNFKGHQALWMNRMRSSFPLAEVVADSTPCLDIKSKIYRYGTVDKKDITIPPVAENPKRSWLDLGNNSNYTHDSPSSTNIIIPLGTNQDSLYSDHRDGLEYEKQKKSPTSDKLVTTTAVIRSWWKVSTRGRWLFKVLIVTLTYVIGATFYHKHLGFKISDAIYFTSTMLTTVGYGDIIPTDSVSQVFTSVYLVILVCILTSVFSSVLDSILEQQIQLARHILKKTENKRVHSLQMDEKSITYARFTALQTTSKLDLTENSFREKQEILLIPEHKVSDPKFSGKQDMENLKGHGSLRPKFEKFTKLNNEELLNIFVACAFLTFSTILGVVWMMKVERFSFLQAVFFVIVTSTTVGFGDLVPHSTHSKIFIAIWMLIAVFSLGKFITCVSEAFVLRKKKRHLVRVLTRERVARSSFDQMDLNKDNQISKFEYLVAQLCQNDIVSQDYIDTIMYRFTQLDKNHDGQLQPDELNVYEDRAN